LISFYSIFIFFKKKKKKKKKKKNKKKKKKKKKKKSNHNQKKCGLPIATYFSAVKYRWILDNATPEILKSLKEGTLRFGTIDTWLIYVIIFFQKKNQID